MDELRWRDPVWLSGAHAWIDERLAELGVARTGEPEQPHVRPWATVLRVPTDRGVVWFKANDESQRHEAAVVERIVVRHCDGAPPLLCVDNATGWMLTAHAGERLREVSARERSLDRWLDVLPRYSHLQLGLADDVAGLLAAGVPDRRLATLPAAYQHLLGRIDADRRLRSAGPLVADLCDELASYGVPELLQHDDLHDGQVFVREGGYAVLDWGDACISHPFFTLSVTLEGVLAWGLDDIAGSVDTRRFRDAYLAPFADYSHADLVAAAAVAVRLGWVCRAINGHVAGREAQTHTRLRVFLDRDP